MNGVIQWTNKLRMNQPFNMFFFDSISAGLDNNESLPKMNLKAPLHAITKQASV